MKNNITLEKKSVALMIVYTLITIAIYVPFWLDKLLQSMEEQGIKHNVSRKGVTILYILYGISAAFLIPSIVLDGAILELIESIDSFISIAGSIMILIFAFQLKEILEKIYTDKLGKDVKLSGVATFFFTILYLQYKINKLEEEV